MIKKVILLLICPLVIYANEILIPEALPESVAFGDAIEIVVQLNKENNTTADFESKSDKFSITDVLKKDNKTIIKVSALETGELKIPKIVVLNGTKQFSIESFSVTVVPNTTEQTKDIFDIKEPVKVYRSDYTLLYVFGIFLLVVIMVLLLRHFLKKEKKKQAVSVIVKTPHEIAMEYYKEAESFWKDGKLDPYVDRVTAGIRAYLEAKKREPFLEMTTKEVERSLKNHFVGEIKSDIISLLKLGDSYKFADNALSKEAFEQMLPEFRKILEKIEGQSSTTHNIKNISG